MSARFFTSDTHLGHRLVSGLRGFELTEEHDKALAENWDRVVHSEDTVFILGDIAMNAKPETFQWFRERPGTKHLIYGNHDSAHPMHTKSLRDQQKWAEEGVFATMNPFARVKFNGQAVLLSHFPYTGEGQRPGPDRYPEYRLRDEGLPLLHGHTHGTETAHGNSFHVGLDAHGLELVSEYTIQNWLDNK